MSQGSQQLATVQPSRGALANQQARPADLPAHIKYGNEAVGLEVVREYIQPPRLKIIQGLTKQELKQQFNEGDLLIMPSKQCVAPVALNQFGKPGDDGTPFYIVPIFFYTEFLSWNPLAPAQAGIVPAIRERSSDPNSLLARKCRTPNLRQEVYADQPKDAQGKDQFISNQEHLNVLVALSTHPELYDTPVLMSFSKGEFSVGQAFCTLIFSRRTDIFANQFVCATKRRTNSKGNWFGFNIQNPALPREGEADMRYEAADLCAYYEQLHYVYAAKYQQGEILTDYDNEENVVDAPVGDGGGKF